MNNNEDDAVRNFLVHLLQCRKKETRSGKSARNVQNEIKEAEVALAVQ